MMIKCKVDKFRKKDTIACNKQNNTFSQEEVGMLLNKVMNLGMNLRQDQLQGYDNRSGNEVLNEFWVDFLKNRKL